jgi:ParB-like chromosome segregation protein Spo0J
MAPKKVSIEIKKLKLKSLKPTPGNPQRMPKKVFKEMAESMKKKGWLLDPPVVWEKRKGSFQIISGHHRVQAAIEAGILETDCKVLKGITPEQASLLVLEANQRKGDFDEKALSTYIDEIIETHNTDIDQIMDEVGFFDLKFIEEEKKEEPEVEFTEELLEEHNYIVLYFDNSVDWLQALTLFKLKTVKALHSKEGFKCQGVGRVINGSRAINKLVKYENIG